MNDIHESLIIGVSFSTEHEGIMIVGRQTKSKIDIINAFSGEEARELYNKLITKIEKEEN